MDQWRVTVLGDGGVGKTALAVQVSPRFLCSRRILQPACLSLLLSSLLSIALLVSRIASSRRNGHSSPPFCIQIRLPL